MADRRRRVFLSPLWLHTLCQRLHSRTRRGASTELFERYQRTEQALVLTLMEMVVDCVSTRKVLRITEELFGKNFRKSTVSALCQQLDPVVHVWNDRRLDT